MKTGTSTRAWRRLLVSGMLCTCLAQVNAAATSGPPDDVAMLKQQHCGDGNMMQMNLCMGREAKESDQRLNLVYAKLIGALAEPRSLQAAQRAWIAFRDAECKFKTAASTGGSMHNFSVTLCLMQLTEQRIAALEEIRPCNGCVRFKRRYDTDRPEAFRLPPRKRIPASMSP
jgi:uncharacterized protein YecT (DUF1311 family)